MTGSVGTRVGPTVDAPGRRGSLTRRGVLALVIALLVVAAVRLVGGDVEPVEPTVGGASFAPEGAASAGAGLAPAGAGPSASGLSASGLSASGPSASGPSGAGASSPAASPSTPGSSPSAASPSSTRSAAGPATLPRGGRTIFPRHRLVGFSGGPGSAAFGRLGVGDLDDRVREIEGVARRYAAGRTPLPVLELITVVVQASPGRDGLYRTRVGDDTIARHLAAARRHRALLLLNVQPGRADFLTEVRRLERWLREPDVGVAIDPEWSVRAGQVPGRVFGSTTGATVDRVAGYLDGLVRAGDLPQKVLVVHQLAPSVLTEQTAIRARAGVAVVKSVDGIGSPGAKTATWKRLVTGMPARIRPGFKLFYEEDARSGRLMTPREVLALRPTPEYVLYE